MATAVAHNPRPLITTLRVADDYGISLKMETNFLFLADLALSLPVPAGWACVERPQGQGPAFWVNEFTGASQYMHPIDMVVKNLLRRLRLKPEEAKRKTSVSQSRRLSLLGQHAQNACRLATPSTTPRRISLMGVRNSKPSI